MFEQVGAEDSAREMGLAAAGTDGEGLGVEKSEGGGAAEVKGAERRAADALRRAREAEDSASWIRLNCPNGGFGYTCY